MSILSNFHHDEPICRSHALHLHPLPQPSYCIDGLESNLEAWERLFMSEQVLVLLWCGKYICLPASVAIYISGSKPRGLDPLDPTLPPSNKFQIVFEEKSAIELHIKDDPNLLTFPPTSILVTDFIASTQYDNIVVYDEMHPRSEEVFKQKNQAPQSDYIYLL